MCGRNGTHNPYYLPHPTWPEVGELLQPDRGPSSHHCSMASEFGIVIRAVPF